MMTPKILAEFKAHHRARLQKKLLGAWGCASQNVGDNNTVKGAWSAFYKSALIDFPKISNSKPNIQNALKYTKKIEIFIRDFYQNKQGNFFPDFFFIAHDAGNNDSRFENNLLAGAVKHSFLTLFNHPVITVSLSDRNLDNTAFDYTHIPEFLIDPKCKKKSPKIIYTDGIIHNVTPPTIDAAYTALKNHLPDTVSKSSLSPIVYILGGETYNGEILFVIKKNKKKGVYCPEVDRLMDEIKTILKTRKEPVLITSTHRTPSLIIDLIYEAVLALASARLFFFNAKPLPTKKGKTTAWNQYTGKYHDTFKKQKSDLFPGILKLNPLFVMTTRDSSMACECANNGVNVGILDYFPGKIIETPSRKGNGRPDCRRFYTMMTRKKYLFDYNAFLKNNEKPVNNWSAQKRMPIALDDVILKLRHDFLENRRQT